MNKPRKRHDGDWWLPGAPDRLVKGALFLSTDRGPRLRLLGRLWDIHHLADTYRAEVIHGRTVEGVDVTLFAGKEITITLGHKRRPSRSVVQTESAFVGAHFLSCKEVLFTGLLIRYTYLNAWAFPPNGLVAELKQPWTHVEVKSQAPPVVEPAIWNGMKISLDLRGTVPRLRNKRITVDQQSWISVEWDGERSYSELVPLIRRLGNFLSLGVSRGVQPIELQAHSPRAHIEDMDGNQYEIPVRVYDTSFFSPHREESISGWQMLFDYPSIAEQFGSMLENWLRQSEDLEAIMNVYFATLQRDLYIEHRFLSLAQALESYHRTVYGGTYLEAKEFRNTVYKHMKGCVPNDISTELRDSILDRLRWAHEYTLRTRLNDLLEKNRDAVTKNIEDWALFLSEVVSTRNHLTHLGEVKASMKGTGGALRELADYLQFLMEICLLRVTGLSPGDIRSLLDSDYRYNHARRWVRYRVPATLGDQVQ